MKKILVIYMIICMTLLSGCSFMPMDSNPGANQSNQTDDSRKEGIYYSTDGEKDAKQDAEKEKSSTNQENEDLMRYTTFYYQDSEGLLIPITRKTPRIEGIGKASIRALIDTPVIREDIGRVGLYPVLPAGVEINGMTIRDGLAKIDFNKQIALGEYSTKQQERNILDAIVYTLAEFHTIDRVQILIEGHKYDTLKFGCPIAEPLINEGINRLGDNMGEDGSTNGELVEVYFTKLINNKYLYYVPVSRIIQNPTSDIEAYMKTLKELIKGDVGDTHLKTYIPAQTTLNGIQVEGQTVILDFDDEILNATASNTSFDIMLNQILLCFKQFGKIRKVKITVNGKALELPEKYAGKTALEVPVYVNQF